MKRCRGCEAEYEDHAEFCNLCGGEIFDPIIDLNPEAKVPAKDGLVLSLNGGIWMAGLFWLFQSQIRLGWLDLFEGWLMISGVSMMAGLLFQNLAPTTWFSALGALCLLLYAWITG